jgi:hypothetical protein
MICEIIRVSSKKPRHEKLIKIIIPYLNNLVEYLKQNMDDSEITLGICRIFVEAGEGYSDVIVENISLFQPVLEGLLLCTSVEDIEVVKITINVCFNLLYLLSSNI